MRGVIALMLIPAGVAVAAINPQYRLEAQNKAPEVLNEKTTEGLAARGSSFRAGRPELKPIR